MAFFKGEEGSVAFKNSSGTLETVVSTTAWSFSTTRDVLECTAHGATQRRYVPSLVTATGTIDFNYTAASGNETANLLQEVIAGNGEDAEFELFLGTSGGKKITFNGIITSMDTGTTIGELTSVSCGFQASMSDPSTSATGIVISA
tara:strand:+ start:76 stop:513 length:438 start_codon:yes stop_codon:yes gene_type:complete